MRKTREGLLVLLSLVIASCMTPVAEHKVPFNEAEFTRYAGSGTSSVVGQAFLKTRGGEVRYGAGNEVVLVPATSYTEETERVIKAGGYIKLNTNDPRYYKYRRVTRADGFGN